MNNPLFRHTRYLLIYIGTWLLVTCIHVLILILNFEVVIYNALLDSAIYNGVYALLGFVIWFPAFYNERGKNQILNTLITHFIAGALVISIWYTTASGLIDMLKTADGKYETVLLNSMSWRIALGILFYLLITLTYYLILFYDDLNEKIKHEAELQRLVTEAELQSLRSQINPHFLFNSLNSINMLTMVEPEKVQQMIIKLSEYLRYSLRKDKSNQVPLSEELHNIKLYLDIEKIRFGKKMDFKIMAPDELLGIEIPHMILQPMVENAVKYGVYESMDENCIDVEIFSSDNYLVMSVSNNVEGDVKSNGEGVGLSNIRKRLKLIYQQDNLLSTSTDDHTFKAVLQIPMKSIPVK